MRLSVNEIFVSVQGEGPKAGVLSAFIRLQGCPVKCTWCDTKYTWHPDYITPADTLTVEEILQKVKKLSGNLMPKNMVITGGEPLAHANKPALRELVESWCDKPDHTLEFETSGVFLPAKVQWTSEIPFCNTVSFNVSPKLSSAEIDLKSQDRFLNPKQILKAWESGAIRTPQIQYKWVIGSNQDVEDLKTLLGSVYDRETWDLERNRHWIMPEAETLEKLRDSSKTAVAVAKELGCNFSYRIHIGIWGGETRGI